MQIERRKAIKQKDPEIRCGLGATNLSWPDQMVQRGKETGASKTLVSKGKSLYQQY